MVQSFGHFDRINFLKLFPEVNLRDISKIFNLGYRDDLMYDQMVIKLVRIIVVKLICNICTLVHSNGLELLSEYLAACNLDKL